MDERESKKSGVSRRFWIPLVVLGLLAIPASRACTADAPSAAPELPPSAPGAASLVPAAAPLPKAKPPERSLSRTGDLCQEWKLGAPPRRVACPATLEDGEILIFERDATCTRRGGTRAQAAVPCPMASELDAPLPPLGERAPPTPDRPLH